jgi:hypothetical protein
MRSRSSASANLSRLRGHALEPQPVGGEDHLILRRVERAVEALRGVVVDEHLGAAPACATPQAHPPVRVAEGLPFDRMDGVRAAVEAALQVRLRTTS